MTQAQPRLLHLVGGATAKVGLQPMARPDLLTRCSVLTPDPPDDADPSSPSNNPQQVSRGEFLLK